MVDLVNSVEKFGKKWYGRRKLGVAPPIKMETPYGGRIIWTLPGETKVICHLKDKNKIRHKKRLEIFYISTPNSFFFTKLNEMIVGGLR